jgi:hypothetical protein
MAPLHDSDIPENRWKDSEWKYFVLWEKLEHQIQKRKRWIVGFTVLLGLGILSIPTIQSRYSKWLGLSIMRRFAVEVHRAEMESSRQRTSILVQLMKDSGAIWILSEAVGSCYDFTERREISRVQLSTPAQGRRFDVLTEGLAMNLSLQNLSQQFCYDPEKGQVMKSSNAPFTALGLIPVKDLSEKRLDRVTILRVTGPQASLSFE